LASKQLSFDDNPMARWWTIFFSVYQLVFVLLAIHGAASG
jgi:hypothetical protein